MKTKDFITYQLPFDYNKAAAADQIMDFSNEVLPDITLQKIFAEFIGSVYIPSLKHETALLIHCGGANGKSVIFDIVRALIGAANISN
jgi:putative DNA primase/helicase